jgi:protease-4
MDFSNPFAMMRLMFGGPPKLAAREPTVAIIHANGMIVGGKSGQGLFGTRLAGAQTLAKCFKQVGEDDKVKAVILRINSPGGSALASELIYQAARKCARRKPVIASISQVGGSGGYYIALGGQKILADPAAITGSIGVLSGKLAMRGLLGKLGITTYEIARGRNASLWSSSREWTARELGVVRKLAQRTYDVFVSRVKASRGKRIKELDAVTQGRIFTARQAAANGLIDSLGGLREAIAAAQSAAKIKSSYIIVLPRPRTLADMFYGGSETAFPDAASPLRQWTRGDASLLPIGGRRAAGIGYLLNLARLLEAETALAAMPHYLSVQP